MKIRLFSLMFYLFLLTNCYAERMDGPYEGKVIDAETGKPIKGVVVLGTWHTVTVTPGGGTHKFYDAEEAITDKDGEFKIKGLGLLPPSNVEPMSVFIFKAGYEYISGEWITLNEDILYEKKIKWEGKRAIIPLRKLTMEERKKQSGLPEPPDEAPLEKVILLLKELDKNDKERGLPSRGIWKGERYE